MKLKLIDVLVISCRLYIDLWCLDQNWCCVMLSWLVLVIISTSSKDVTLLELSLCGSVLASDQRRYGNYTNEINSTKASSHLTVIVSWSRHHLTSASCVQYFQSNFLASSFESDNWRKSGRTRPPDRILVWWSDPYESVWIARFS